MRQKQLPLKNVHRLRGQYIFFADKCSRFRLFSLKQNEMPIEEKLNPGFPPPAPPVSAATFALLRTHCYDKGLTSQPVSHSQCNPVLV